MLLTRSIPQTQIDTIHIVAIRKPGECYVWIYTPVQAEATVQHAAGYASRADLSLTWLDAGSVAVAVRSNA